MSSTNRRGTIAVLLGLVVLFGVFMALPRATTDALITEGGPVETVTVVLYFAAAALTLLRLGGRADRLHLLSVFFLVLFALREMDFHDRFTSRGITMLRFYTSPEVPLLEKLVVVLVLAVIGGALLLLGRDVLSRLRTGWRPPLPVVAALALIPISIAFDRLVRMLVYDAGLPAGGTLAFSAFVFEETSELAIPALFLLAAATTRKAARSG